nr:LCP family protein [Cellulomonas gelida]
MPLTAQPAAPTSRHARGRRERRALRVVALTALAAMTFTGTAALTFVVRLDDNIHHLDLDPLLGPRPTAAAQAQDPAEGRALTLLLLGSDSRAGKNGTIGGTVADSMRSDTTIVLHVSADRSRVELVSIPRDSMVAIPQCTTTSGETIAASEYSRFNKAFALGWDHGQDLESAAACAWRTVEATTGVLVDDFLLVDFVGFRDMVDAVEGCGSASRATWTTARPSCTSRPATSGSQARPPWRSRARAGSRATTAWTPGGSATSSGCSPHSPTRRCRARS